MAQTEAEREYARRWRAKNREAVLAGKRRWYLKHRDERLLYAKKYNVSTAPEVVAETYLLEQVKLRGGLCPKFVDPSRRGAPDRMVLLPGHPVYFVEMKRQIGGRIKPWQERYHADLRALGHRVEVLWSKEDVEKFLASV